MVVFACIIFQVLNSKPRSKKKSLTGDTSMERSGILGCLAQGGKSRKKNQATPNDHMLAPLREISFKISNEHLPPFHMGAPSPWEFVRHTSNLIVHLALLICQTKIVLLVCTVMQSKINIVTIQCVKSRCNLSKICSFGQNKKEQLTPCPKAMSKARRSKSAPFWHQWNWREGWSRCSIYFFFQDSRSAVFH